MSNTPTSASTEQKPVVQSAADPRQSAAGQPAAGHQQTQGKPQQNQGGNKANTDKPAGQPQQK